MSGDRYSFGVDEDSNLLLTVAPGHTVLLLDNKNRSMTIVGDSGDKRPVIQDALTVLQNLQDGVEITFDSWQILPSFLNHLMSDLQYLAEDSQRERLLCFLALLYRTMRKAMPLPGNIGGEPVPITPEDIMVMLTEVLTIDPQETPMDFGADSGLVH